MRRAFQLAVVLLLLAAMSRSEIIDCIVATVNNEPILQSDWDVALRYQAFVDQRALDESPAAARAALERLIDQELLRQQIRTFNLQPISPDEVRQHLRDIRQQTPDGATDAGWRAALDRYGLSEAELSARVADQLEITRFVDVRLRPTVRLDRASIEAYYKDKLLPQMKQKGAGEVPLVQVTRQIEEVLSQERMDTMLSEWLRDLRQQSEIKINAPAPQTSARQEAR
jgi:SurA N-terminal domain